jgi:SAM-dependent methyltransferase
MQILDKKNVLNKISSMDKVVLELGCGNSPTVKNAITIDIVDLDKVDIVADLNKGLSFLPDNSVDEIYSYHFLEHLSDLDFFMKEIYRVLKNGGKKIGSVPHFSNPYYYSDYTHRSFFGLYTFCYFSKQKYYRRGVPTFYSDIDFKINNIRLLFYSPFFMRNVVKKACNCFFNSSKYWQEFYESSFCYTFPCHEIRFEIEKNINPKQN